MKLEAPHKTVIHTIEKAIKEYRKFGHKNIKKVADDITIDQGLVLIILDQNSDISQKEIAELIFKDYASMTRIIDLMVKKGYLKRAINTIDRRRFKLSISAKGKQTIKKIVPVIKQNRSTALNGLTQKEITQLYNSLNKVIANCNA